MFAKRQNGVLISDSKNDELLETTIISNQKIFMKTLVSNDTLSQTLDG